MRKKQDIYFVNHAGVNSLQFGLSISKSPTKYEDLKKKKTTQKEKAKIQKKIDQERKDDIINIVALCIILENISMLF